VAKSSPIVPAAPSTGENYGDTVTEPGEVQETSSILTSVGILKESEGLEESSMTPTEATSTEPNVMETLAMSSADTYMPTTTIVVLRPFRSNLMQY